MLEERLIARIASCAEAQGGLEAPCALALSGGRDSVVLGEAMRRAGLRFEAWHFNHRWRGVQSEADAAWVADWCRERGIPMRTGRARAGTARTEAAARAARQAFFQRQSVRRGIGWVWLAHHADDAAETVLLQLMRGAGVQGLAGMRESRRQGDLCYVRPLLAFRRRELAIVARRWRLAWREDPTNADASHRRNLLRLRGLPALSRWAGRDVVPLLVRTADILAAEEAYWEEILPDARCAALPLKPLRGQPIAWQRRVIRRWLEGRGVEGVGFEVVESVRRMLDAPSPARINLGRGAFCRRRAGVFFIE